MKTFNKMFLMLAILSSGVGAMAQRTDYAAVMTAKVAILDSAQLADYPLLAADFSRIASVEGSDWLASYYAAYCHILVALTDPTRADALCADAEKCLAKSESLDGDLSEIACLRSLNATARMLVDLQSRWQTDGQESSEQLAKAIGINPLNPRAYYLQAQSLIHTPAQFGGGKDKARPVIEKSIACYGAAKVSPAYAPHWGRQQAEQIRTACLAD